MPAFTTGAAGALDALPSSDPGFVVEFTPLCSLQEDPGLQQTPRGQSLAAVALSTAQYHLHHPAAPPLLAGSAQVHQSDNRFASSEFSGTDRSW